MGLSLYVGIRFQGLFHSPHRGSFHLSLTVLFHYRSVSSILPWKMVLPASDRIPRVPSYSGYSTVTSSFRLRDFHPLWLAFPNHSSITLSPTMSPTTPMDKSIGLGTSAFDRLYWRNLVWLLFLQVLRCFTSLRSLYRTYFTQCEVLRISSK